MRLQKDVFHVFYFSGNLFKRSINFTTVLTSYGDVYLNIMMRVLDMGFERRWELQKIAQTDISMHPQGLVHFDFLVSFGSQACMYNRGWNFDNPQRGLVHLHTNLRTDTHSLDA